MDLQQKLAQIQRELKAPKNCFNSFGGYKYRSAENILEAVKPLLGDAVLTITDEVVEIAGSAYVKATASIFLGKEHMSVNGMAREAASKKGMDTSQITGSTSSYARKYALGGLFLIDDTEDADAANNSEDYTQPAPPPTLSREQQANISALADEKGKAVGDICKAYNVANISAIQATAYEKIIARLEAI